MDYYFFVIFFRHTLHTQTNILVPYLLIDVLHGRCTERFSFVYPIFYVEVSEKQLSPKNKNFFICGPFLTNDSLFCRYQKDKQLLLQKFFSNINISPSIRGNTQFMPIYESVRNVRFLQTPSPPPQKRTVNWRLDAGLVLNCIVLVLSAGIHNIYAPQRTINNKFSFK